jgi:cytochrome c1
MAARLPRFLLFDGEMMNLRVFSAILLTSLGALFGCSDKSVASSSGRLLIERYQCGTCHHVPGVNAAAGRVAVTLESFGVRSYIAGHVPNTQENLVLWIMDPHTLVPGTLMPDMGVTLTDAQQIAADLRQLR